VDEVADDAHGLRVELWLAGLHHGDEVRDGAGVDGVELVGLVLRGQDAERHEGRLLHLGVRRGEELDERLDPTRLAHGLLGRGIVRHQGLERVRHAPGDAPRVGRPDVDVDVLVMLQEADQLGHGALLDGKLLLGRRGHGALEEDADLLSDHLVAPARAGGRGAVPSGQPGAGARRHRCLKRAWGVRGGGLRRAGEGAAVPGRGSASRAASPLHGLVEGLGQLVRGGPVVEGPL